MAFVARSTSKLLALAGLAVLAPATAGATVMLQLSIEDMAVKSSAVVRGKVISGQAEWDQEHQRIYTYTTVEVLEQIHATSSLPKQITIRTLGGEVGKIGMKVSGVEKLAPNEEVVLFVTPDPVITTTFQVVGMSQGKYTIEHETSGRAIAVPGAEGLAFVKPDQGTGTLKVDPSVPRPDRIALTELKSRVLAAVATQGAVKTSTQIPTTTPSQGTTTTPVQTTPTTK